MDFTMAVSTRIISTLLFCSAASLHAQAPVVTLTKTTQKTEISIRHPNVLTSVNWNTFRFWINGIDSTSALLSLLFTPKFPVDLQTNELKISILLDFSAFPMAAKACSLKDGKCEDSFRRIRNGSCYPNVACTNNEPWLPNDVTGPSIFSVVGIRFKVVAPLNLASLGAVVGTSIGPPVPPWRKYLYELNVWGATRSLSARQAFDASPLVGNVVANMAFEISTTQLNAKDHYARFSSKSARHIGLQPGDYIISMKFRRNGIVSIFFAIRHSRAQGFLQSDLIHDDTFSASKTLTSFNLKPGIAAIDLYGY